METITDEELGEMPIFFEDDTKKQKEKKKELEKKKLEEHKKLIEEISKEE